MRASFMTINSVDLQQAVKEVARSRFVKAPRVDTDSDYAGCVPTRKSTTCAHLFYGVNLIKAGSWTQGTRSFECSESEFYAGVKGASILLGAKTMMIDFGEDVAQCVLQLSQKSHGKTWGRTNSTFSFSYVLVAVKSISPIQENSIKHGYDENDDNNMSDETKCETNYSMNNKWKQHAQQAPHQARHQCRC